MHLSIKPISFPLELSSLYFSFRFASLETPDSSHNLNCMICRFSTISIPKIVASR